MTDDKDIDDILLEQQAQWEQQENLRKSGSSGGNGQGKDIFEKLKEGSKTTFIQKISDDNLLAEAIIVDGIPYFAVSQLNPKGEVIITLERSIPISEVSGYKPYEKEAYLNKPYTFKSKENFELVIEDAKNENLDTIYKKVKSIWSTYIDADDFHISICAADTMFTYIQDKIGMTHYLYFVGNNGSGKSNNLLVLKFLAYRNFTSTDMTAANIYQFLGDREEGQGTLCEDEADRIDEDRQKMAIYKNGYITGFPVARTDTSHGRKQLKLNTYGFKAFAAERFPDSLKAKGFNQRVLEMPCYYGDPKEDIAEIANPAGAEEFQDLLNELEETRNLLLVYRLLHYHEKIPDIKLNIKGREKQLFKPVIRVFQKTETLDELLPVITNYVAQKREANDATFNSFLYKAIVDMISSLRTSVLPSRLVWDYITSNLEGTEIPGRNQSYETTEFGIISQREVTQTLVHVFGAKSKKVGGTKHLAFDVAKLQRLGKVYDLSIKVEILEESSTKDAGKTVGDLGDLVDHMETCKGENSSEQATFHEGIEGEQLANKGVVGSLDGPNGPYGPQNESKNGDDL